MIYEKNFDTRVCMVTVEKKEEPVTMKVSSSVLNRLDQIASAEDRPRGYVARELMMRGLALFEKDGQLRDPNNRKAIPVLKEPAK